MAVNSAFGQTTVTTAPVGFVTGTCLANSDTILNVPLAQAADFVGSISATPTINGSLATVVASGTSPGWTTNQFALLYSGTPSYPTYYLKFTSGTLSGHYYTVTANDASSVTFDANGEAVTSATTGDQFSLTKYWTLGTLFPPSTSGTPIVQSASTLAFQRRTTVLLPNLSGTGFNLAPNQIFFLTSTGWKKDASGFPDATNQVLFPDTYFIVRHPAAVTAPTTYTFTGSVNTDRAVTFLSTIKAGKQDNFVVLQRPVPVRLDQSGLSTGFVPSSNTLAFNRRDVLMVFDNSVAAINKAASKQFFMVGTSWVQDTSGFPNADAYTLDPTVGLIIRKYQTTTGTSAVWTNDPNFTVQ